MGKKVRRVRFLGRTLLIIYLVLAIYFMFFAEMLDRTMVSTGYRYNLTFFKEINRFWAMRNDYGWHVTLVNLVGNVVCFMPFGFLLPTITKSKMFKNVVVVTFYAMMFSMLIEVAQLISRVGAFDVDDILLNTIGGLLGYIIYITLKVIMRKRSSKRK